MHLQLEHPELICDRDRQKFPEILDSPLPIWDTLNYPYSVITVPIHWGADRSRNLYSKMKQKELTEHATRIIDLSEYPNGREYIGNVSIYLELLSNVVYGALGSVPYFLNPIDKSYSIDCFS